MGGQVENGLRHGSKRRFALIKVAAVSGRRAAAWDWCSATVALAPQWPHAGRPAFGPHGCANSIDSNPELLARGIKTREAPSAKDSLPGAPTAHSSCGHFVE